MPHHDMPHVGNSVNVSATGSGVGRRFSENESFMHKAAKATVLRWVRSSIVKTRHGREFDRWGLYARSARAYAEYPIGTKDEGYWNAWDEMDGGAPNAQFARNPPTVEWMISQGMKPLCVCDIMIIHKGMPFHALEIVHKHPTPEWKKRELRALNINLLELSAYAILSQFDIPATLPIWTK